MKDKFAKDINFIFYYIMFANILMHNLTFFAYFAYFYNFS